VGDLPQQPGPGTGSGRLAHARTSETDDSVALAGLLEGVRLGRLKICHPRRPGPLSTGGEYSREAPQRVRMPGDWRGLAGTVTCGDGRGWTCCRQMACKRSAVRARLAPLVRSKIRTDRTASTAGKYSNGGRVGRRTCVRIGHLRRLGLLAGHRVQALNRRWPACHLCKSQSRLSRDSCCLITTRPSWRALPASDCCRICK